MYYKKFLLIVCLLSQTLYAKPLITFIVSSDCPHCHTLMKDIDSNQKLMSLLASEYDVQVIDTLKSNVPRGLPFDGEVPTIVITNDKDIVGKALKGAIPSSELLKYLFHVTDYLKNNNKEVYYAN